MNNDDVKKLEEHLAEAQRLMLRVERHTEYIDMVNAWVAAGGTHCDLASPVTKLTLDLPDWLKAQVGVCIRRWLRREVQSYQNALLTMEGLKGAYVVSEAELQCLNDPPGDTALANPPEVAEALRLAYAGVDKALSTIASAFRPQVLEALRKYLDGRLA